jgi:hypothetical protein
VNKNKVEGKYEEKTDTRRKDEERHNSNSDLNQDGLIIMADC